jgi:uncharacterized membrane protein
MKKKDIITIIVSLIVMIVALYFGLKMMGVIDSDKKEAVDVETEVDKIYVPGEIDEETLQELNKFNDYGEASLDNIGRVNPFGPL